MPYGRARGADHGWQPWAGPGDGRNVSQGWGESRHCRATSRCAPGGRAGIAAASDGTIKGYPGDVGKAADCQQVVDAAVADLGPIDILVNNAGTSVRGPFLEQTDDAWQADFALKVFAHIRLCRLVIPGMQQRRWGRIINVLNTGAKAPRAEGAPHPRCRVPRAWPSPRCWPMNLPGTTSWSMPS